MPEEAKANNAVLVAASIIAAVRLAREEIKETPKVVFQVSQSVQLARMILKKVESGS